MSAGYAKDTGILSFMSLLASILPNMPVFFLEMSKLEGNLNFNNSLKICSWQLSSALYIGAIQ